MDSLQEAFIHPPDPCKAHFIMVAHALFDINNNIVKHFIFGRANPVTLGIGYKNVTHWQVTHIPSFEP